MNLPICNDRTQQEGGIFLGVFLVTLLAVGGLTPISGAAQDGTVVSVRSQEAPSGAAVDVPIDVSEFTQIGSVSLVVTYDPDVLSFPEGAESEDYISDAVRSGFMANVLSPGELRISWFDASGSNPIDLGDGKLLEITFSEFAGDTTEVAFGSGSEISDAEANPIEVTFEGGIVSSRLGIPIVEARDRGPGTAVTVEGTVTRAFGSYVRIQDDSGPTGASGLVIRQVEGGLSSSFRSDISDGIITQGTRLQVRGVLSDFDGLFQINNEDLISYSVQGQGTVPQPQDVELSSLIESGEDYESELVQVQNLRFTNPDTTGGVLNENFTYIVEGPGGTTFQYRVQGVSETNVIGAPINPGSFIYTGVVGESSGTFRLVPVRTSTGLPVEVASFVVQVGESGATLRWETASETRNAGFEVEHRGPVQADFVKLGFVESKVTTGTASKGRSYRFRAEGLKAGTHQFRLKQKDLNGASTVVGKREVNVEMAQALTLEAPSPNPVSGHAALTFGLRGSSEAEVVVYNMLGQRVKTLYDGTPQAGQVRQLSFDASGLPSGTYFVRLQVDGRVRTKRLTVVH